MIGRKNNVVFLFSIGAMVLLILDAQTAIRSTANGLLLCLETIIPSLFPFMILSGIITNAASGIRSRMLNPVSRIFRIPKGCEPLLLTGLLGGYPVGAKCVNDAYSAGSINLQTAKRLLRFCNNAGPAFIFGITIPLFRSKWIPWVLWGIQICSCYLISLATPQCSQLEIQRQIKKAKTSIMQSSIKAMGTVCGWVMIFRVIIGILDKWILGTLPAVYRTVLSCCLELSNGCVRLSMIDSEQLRFIICSGALSFGGCCIFMQTASIVGNIGFGAYLKGKLTQTLISLFLSVPLSYLLYPESTVGKISAVIISLIAVLPFIFICFKNYSSKIEPSVV